MRDHAKVVLVTIGVPAQAGADAEALKAAIENLVSRALRASPDHRFDWRHAVVIANA